MGLFFCELQGEDSIRKRQGESERGNEVSRGDLPRERCRERAVKMGQGSFYHYPRC